MTYIFGIFFILELLFVVMLCRNIYVLDKKVRHISENFKVNRHTLKFQLRAVYDIANRTKLWIKCQKREAEIRRKTFLRGMLKGLLVSVAIFFFQKTRFRKKVLLVELLLIFYDTLKANCSV